MGMHCPYVTVGTAAMHGVASAATIDASVREWPMCGAHAMIYPRPVLKNYCLLRKGTTENSLIGSNF